MLKLSIFGILHTFEIWSCDVFMDAKQRQILKSNSTLLVELNPNGLLFDNKCCLTATKTYFICVKVRHNKSLLVLSCKKQLWRQKNK